MQAIEFGDEVIFISEAVARKHYLHVTDAHFEKAVQAKSFNLVGHIVGHNMCETTQMVNFKKTRPPKKPVFFGGCVSLRVYK